MMRIVIAAVLSQSSLALRLPGTKLYDGHRSTDLQKEKINKQAHDLFYATHPVIAKKNKYSVEAAVQALSSRESMEKKLRDATFHAFTEAKDDLFQFHWRSCAQDLDEDVDLSLDSSTGFEPLIKWFKKNPDGIPIVKLGYCKSGDNGQQQWVDFFLIEHISEKWKEAKRLIADDKRQFSVVTAGNENWGHLSLWHQNRTTGWRLTFSSKEIESVLTFLEDPMLWAWFHLQHIDIKHPKILNIPLMSYSDIKEKYRFTRKTDFVGYAGSDVFGRGKVVAAAKKTLGEDFHLPKKYRHEYRHQYQYQYEEMLARTSFFLSPPGLGGDCYRTWEALQMGTIPIIERGYGMDSLSQQLPIHLVDDLEKISPELLRAVEPYFWLHASDFNWNLIRKSYWFGGMRNTLPQSDRFLERFIDLDLPLAPHATEHNDHTQRDKSFSSVILNQGRPWGFGFLPRS